MKIGLVIMASGLGKRFGGDKLMEELGGKPLIKWIIDATEEIFDARVVVTRSTKVKELCQSLGIDVVWHDLPNRNDTVRLGLSFLIEKKDIDFCFFVPGDQPLISKGTLEKLFECAEGEAAASQDKIVRTSFRSTPGAPIGFSKAFYKELLNLPEKKGGSWVANNNNLHVENVEVEYEYELWDVDTTVDLEKIKQIIAKEG